MSVRAEGAETEVPDAQVDTPTLEAILKGEPWTGLVFRPAGGP